MAEPIVLSNRQILKIRDGLRALDGVPGRPGETIRFDFESALSWNITKNTVIVERAVDTYELERAKITKAAGITPGASITDANAGNVDAWNGKIQELKNQTQSLNGLLKLKRAELQKAGKIPPGTLANLFELIEE